MSVMIRAIVQSQNIKQFLKIYMPRQTTVFRIKIKETRVAPLACTLNP